MEVTHSKVDELIQAIQGKETAIRFLLDERSAIDAKLAKLGHGAPLLAAAEPKKRGRKPGTKNKPKADPAAGRYSSRLIFQDAAVEVVPLEADSADFAVAVAEGCGDEA